MPFISTTRSTHSRILHARIYYSRVFLLIKHHFLEQTRSSLSRVSASIHLSEAYSFRPPFSSQRHDESSSFIYFSENISEIVTISRNSSTNLPDQCRRHFVSPKVCMPGTSHDSGTMKHQLLESNYIHHTLAPRGEYSQGTARHRHRKQAPTQGGPLQTTAHVLCLPPRRRSPNVESY